jgi:hypothetical protein
MKTEKILILEDKKTNIASYYILQNNDEYVGLSDNTIKIGYFEGFELLLTTNYNVYQLKINRELISIFTKISENCDIITCKFIFENKIDIILDVLNLKQYEILLHKRDETLITYQKDCKILFLKDTKDNILYADSHKVIKKYFNYVNIKNSLVITKIILNDYYDFKFENVKIGFYNNVQFI